MAFNNKKAEEARADALWFLNEIVALTERLKTIVEPRRIDFLRQCCTKALTQHAKATSDATDSPQSSNDDY